MILKEWLKKEGVKAYVFAYRVGVAPATIYRSISGHQRMSARYAVRIEEETKGHVSRTEAMWPEGSAIQEKVEEK